MWLIYLKMWFFLVSTAETINTLIRINVPMKRYIIYYVIFSRLVIKLSIYSKLITVPIFIRTFDLIYKISAQPFQCSVQNLFLLLTIDIHWSSPRHSLIIWYKSIWLKYLPSAGEISHLTGSSTWYENIRINIITPDHSGHLRRDMTFYWLVVGIISTCRGIGLSLSPGFS